MLASYGFIFRLGVQGMLLKNRFVTSVAVVALASVIGAAGVAQAQTTADTTTAPAPPKKPKSDSSEVEGLVITGSRIKQTNYNSADPITQITQQQATLTGAIDTAQILQLSSVANNNVQINNNFTGYVVTGGPGVNTLSLRGLGAQRTLILIDGQRMGPAGVGGTVGPVDLNTIPISIIDHVDIDNTGASSIYGSDAVAGVVNIITKKNMDGGDLKITGNPSQQGGGEEYDVQGSWGKTFDRGYVTTGFDVYVQEALKNGQRDYLNCARDIATVPGTNTSADIIDPSTGQPKCNNLFLSPGIEDVGDGLLYRPEKGGVPSGYDYDGGALDVPGFQAVGINNNTLAGSGLPTLTPAQTRASESIVPYAPPQFAQADAVSPVSRYTFTLNGGFDLTPHAQLYGSFLFNERKSEQVGVSQFFGADLNPVQNPGFVEALPVLAQLSFDSQTVNYYRTVVGVKGDLPSFGGLLNNWTYDVYGQAAIDQGSYTTTYNPTDRVNAVLDADYDGGNPAGGALGCDARFLNANDHAACVPFNVYQAVANGGFTPQQQAFLYQQATGHTSYDHYYIEPTATGDVFKLPAGMVKAAIGGEFRWESLDDTPPAAFVAQNAYNLSTTGITKGSESSQEVYGELQIPVLADFPLVKRFDITVSGRYSNYSNYGSNGTYKVGIDWQVTDWLTFRGTHGTAFRAPELYEQYLADQSSFLGQLSIDPCINYGTTNISANVKKNCAAAGLPANYAGGGESAEILQGGGAGLKPETSINNTIGIVFQPKWFGLNLKAAVTYYDYDIKNQISNFGAANILYQCYNSNTYPNNPFCQLFTRTPYVAGSPAGTTGGITTVNDDFVNIAEEVDQGLDWETTYVANLPRDFKLTIDANMAWTFYTKTTLLNGLVNNYLGQVGQPAFNGNVNFRLDHGPWTFNYYLYMVGPQSDNDFVASQDTNYYDTGETVDLNHKVPFYTTSDISVQRRFDKFIVTAGVKNVYDTPPPYYSAEGFQYREGVVPLASQFDLVGRSFFVSLEKKF